MNRSDHKKMKGNIEMLSPTIVINQIPLQVKIEILEITEDRDGESHIVNFSIIPSEDPDNLKPIYRNLLLKKESLFGTKLEFMLKSVKFTWILPCQWSIKTYRTLSQLLSHHLIP